MRTLWILVAVSCVLLVTADKSQHKNCDVNRIMEMVRNACSVRPKRSPGPETPFTREDLLSQLGALRGGRRSHRAIRSNVDKLLRTCCHRNCQPSDFAGICNTRIQGRK